MTDMYEHLRPNQEAYGFPALQMQWQHSTLQEDDFLSPWMAIERATDLALEVGAPSTMCVDTLSLPPKFCRRSKSVRFDLHEVQVIEGYDFVEKFQTPNIFMQNHIGFLVSFRYQDLHHKETQEALCHIMKNRHPVALPADNF